MKEKQTNRKIYTASEVISDVVVGYIVDQNG
jgi:hypothetical protein